MKELVCFFELALHYWVQIFRAGLKVEDALLETDPTIDAKIRSQERKKTVEGKVDKKSQAMDALKASRDAKKQRAEEREREKKNRQESERKRDDGDDDMDFKRENDSSSVVGDKKQKKLKASDVYSDDSGSDSDDDVKKERRSSDSDSRSSDSEDEDRYVSVFLCFFYCLMVRWLHPFLCPLIFTFSEIRSHTL